MTAQRTMALPFLISGWIDTFQSRKTWRHDTKRGTRFDSHEYNNSFPFFMHYVFYYFFFFFIYKKSSLPFGYGLIILPRLYLGLTRAKEGKSGGRRETGLTRQNWLMSSLYAFSCNKHISSFGTQPLHSSHFPPCPYPALPSPIFGFLLKCIL